MIEKFIRYWMKKDTISTAAQSENDRLHAYSMGWDRCCREIPDHTTYLLSCRNEFLTAFESSDPRERDKFFVSLWGDRNWRWPWLDEWERRFLKEGMDLPWSRKTKPRSFSSPEEWAFAGTAMRRAYEEWDWQRTIRVLSYRGSWKPGMPFPATSLFGGWRLVPGKDDHLGVAQKCFERFLAGDHDFRPPYFPLDGSRIELLTKRQSKAQDRC